MRTTTLAPRDLLTDETWSQIPRASADRRVVAAVLMLFVLAIPGVIAVNSAGLLAPRLSYEGGSAASDNHSHTIALDLVVANNSARSWTISGASIDAPGVQHDIRIKSRTIAAHHRGTIHGTIAVNCAARPAPVSSPGVSVTRPGDYNGDINLRVRRVLGTTAVTMHNVFDAQMLQLACAT